MSNMHDGQDEFFVEHDEVRRFIDEVQRARSVTPVAETMVEDLKPAFGRLLSTQGWLPEEFSVPYEASGMGGGIGQYLLYRSADKSLTLFSLVVPSGSSTPVHDHLAWGLVGLYQGEQHEEVYALERGNADRGDAALKLAEERDLTQGEFYALLAAGWGHPSRHDHVGRGVHLDSSARQRRGLRVAPQL